MKKILLSCATGRTITSALLLTSSLALTWLAIKTDGLDLHPMSGTKIIRQILAGPGRYAELAGKLAGMKQSPQSTVATSNPEVATPAPASGEYIGFELFEAPGALVNVTSSSQGPSANTVEYLAHDAGEPSIGVNWQSTQDSTKGITVYQSDLQTAFIKFDDSCPASGQKAAWYMSQAPTSQFVDSDPIGFVDPQTGRAFCGQLTLTSPGCKISFTDTDGKDPIGNPGPAGWVGTTGPAGSGIDHETIGGGPYHLINGIAPPHSPTYADAVYYCSQDLGPAFCLRSDDGGANWAGPFAMNTIACGGLHGHVKVAPDGTAYVPNNDCGGTGAVVVSTDNGVTWTARGVPNTVSGQSDPAVAIDKAGRAYFITSSSAGSGSQAIVATSTDQGQTWQNTFDVGAAYGLANVTYPAAVAGDSGRAAVAFYGSTTGGNLSQDGANGFAGVWHLYIAETFDGGAHWTTTDATPNAPLQRGCIWTGGGVNICRNLLDFYDMTVDKQGRVQVGYVNGCAGGNCMQAAPTAFGNAYTATATIARQSSGKRMFAANDPPATGAPGMPFVSQRRVGLTIHLAWSEADTGNSSILNYQILRGTTSNAETLIATVPGTQTGGTFDDLTATDTTKTYFYKVVAVNALGASCGNNEIAARFVGNGCTGLIVQKTPAGHPEQPGGAGAAPASLAIDYVAVGEPPNTSNLMFQMKVTSFSGGLPPNSRWRIVWDSYKSSGQQFYVGMRTDANSAPTFDYGEVMTGSIPPVVGLIGVPIETFKGAALLTSNQQPDGTITVFVPKSAVGSPLPGDLLGAVCGRTFTGDNAQTNTLERSTLLVDHTFVKAQRDNGSPAATYTVLGNAACEGGIVPLKAVSSKTHDSINPPFEVSLPLSGKLGIECRKGQPNANDHQVIVTFPGPITLVGTPTISTGTGSVSGALASGNQVFINLNAADGQRIAITLTVSDGINIGPVVVPMGILLGDTNADANVDGTDVAQTKSQSGNAASNTGLVFREDINLTGFVDGTDVSFVKSRSGGHISNP